MLAAALPFHVSAGQHTVDRDHVQGVRVLPARPQKPLLLQKHTADPQNMRTRWTRQAGRLTTPPNTSSFSLCAKRT